MPHEGRESAVAEFITFMIQFEVVPKVLIKEWPEDSGTAHSQQFLIRGTFAISAVYE